MFKFFRKIRQSLLAESKFSKYLIYALGEIILVVIGILIALQINNWNEERKSARQETLYIHRLLTENSQDVNTFAAAIEGLKKGNKSIEEFSAALRKKDADASLIQKARDYFRYGSIYPIFTASTSTFEDLSSTGNLQVIKNTELRDEIVKHYAKHKIVKERIQISIDWGLKLDAPFTFENNIMQFEPLTSFLFPQHPDENQVEELILKSDIYIGNAAAHYWINNDAISYINELKEETNNLILHLETKLSRK